MPTLTQSSEESEDDDDENLALLSNSKLLNGGDKSEDEDGEKFVTVKTGKGLRKNKEEFLKENTDNTTDKRKRDSKGTGSDTKPPRNKIVKKGGRGGSRNQ